jgi:uncharacterized protein (TIGR03435 family)
MPMTKAILGAALLFPIQGFSQPAANTLSFEAASIKPSKPGAASFWKVRPGGITIQNMTLRDWIRIACEVKVYQVTGGPGWLDTERFDLEAKPAGRVTGPELVAMLRTLLAERCQLAFHRESKVFPGYALLVSKKGLKIQPAEGVEGSRIDEGRNRLTAKNLSMVQLAESLTRFLGDPVVDMTGIAGGFSYQLEWTPESTQSAKPDGQAVEPAPGPSLFTVLQEQLGLKLETHKVPLEVVVVDRVEKPSEN